ncbi:DNA replication and repair protein recF [Caldalkalibacillus thermarum TA2.A1]|uniref:DNA replication and repair protein RecF n=1 Tax=Caldalkalibacillus thermarum (strain TA2.A1) TaxID=986075 RepID=F5L541_CALTT|nr:DNA replication/repair protein RecF [Caldalkalibacillus thermarum]EGL83543.1 DNA replication and repair protein recF [Caldalkalibacillus thermarum TA2.A1]
MYVKRLTLQHFRNYATLELEFQPGIYLFIGDNAQGKTNLLESLYVLAMTKSHRTSKDKELIQWHKAHTTLAAELEKKYGSVTLELHISQRGKRAKLNHLEQKRLSDYIGTLNVVMFAPEDLELVKGSPQVRRRFIDMELGQVSANYLYDLGRYQKLLMQRNALLKEWTDREKHRPMVDVFTQQLIDVAVKLYQKRFKFLHKLEQWAQEIHSRITKGKESLEIRYHTATGIDQTMNEEEMTHLLTQQFAKMRDREEHRGSTLIGPHRDDLIFMVNNRNVHTYGSQGQQRTAALSLKLAEIELIKEEIGEYPVLLLDDVLSELDDQRRTDLLQAIQDKVQTFVTNTSTEGIDSRLLAQARVYYVREGHIAS